MNLVEVLLNSLGVFHAVLLELLSRLAAELFISFFQLGQTSLLTQDLGSGHYDRSTLRSTV